MNMKKEEIDALFRTGKRLYSPLIKVVYLPSKEREIIISAPIRVFKRAVDRNRIKRQIRESIKDLKIGNFHIAIIYNGTKLEKSEDIKSDIEKIVPRIK